jgi:hypothetical protein
MVAMFRAHREQLIAVIGVFAFLPAFAIGWLVPQPEIAPSGLNAFAVMQQWVFDHWFVLIIEGVIGAIGHVTVYAMLLRKEAMTLAAAFRVGIVFLPSLVVANLLIGLIFGFGLILFIVPGFYLMARTSVAGAAMVAESRLDPAAAIGRSVSLSRGNGWRIFIMFALIFVIWAVTTMVAGGVANLMIERLLPESIADFATAIVDALTGSVIGLAALLFSAATYRQLTAA